MEEFLLDTKFLANIRKYNAAFSFISFNATSDKNLSKSNVYTLRIQGQIHHHIGPLLPYNQRNPVNAQVYFNDENHVNNRQNYSSGLDAFILMRLQAMLNDDCANPFVLQFKRAATIYKQNPHADIQIRIVTNKDVDRRRYNQPTAQEVAVIIPGFGESDHSNEREVLVFEKNGYVKKINTNHAAYDPLMYPLIFPSGQLGWAPNTILLNDNKNKCESDKHEDEQLNDNIDAFNDLSDEIEDLNTLINQENISEDQQSSGDSIDTNLDSEPLGEDSVNKDFDSNFYENIQNTNNKKKMRFVSSMQYYAYLLCDRPGNHLHYYGRLFHQFIVDQYTKIELGRLNFFRHNQEKLRADKYQNIKETNPENLGKTTGKRIILPSTYKGTILRFYFVKFKI